MPGSFVTKFNSVMQQQGRHVLLLCDNASCHKLETTVLSNVKVVYLPPNLTAWLQPMDAGIIRTFKAKYKALFTRFAIDRDSMGVADPYKIDQLQAMHLASCAWDAVSAETIQSCWRHTGICPSVDMEDLKARFLQARL